MAEQDKNLNQTPAGENKAASPVSSDKPVKTEKKKEARPNVFVRAARRIKKWFRDLRSEAKKVVWPNGKQVFNNTVVVIVCIIAVGLFVALLDTAFGFIRGLLIDLV